MPSRAQLVAALRDLYARGEHDKLNQILGHIRDHGELHDPEWVACTLCGHPMERPLHTVRDSFRCGPCHRGGRPPATRAD